MEFGRLLLLQSQQFQGGFAYSPFLYITTDGWMAGFDCAVAIDF